MGSYLDAIAAYRAAIDPVPDITAYRVRGRIKYGFALSAEQEVADGMHGFLRAGWNDGEDESFAYTGIDDTVLVGFDAGRGRHKLGVAAVSSGISALHREYLRLGGEGFLLGDGTLRYGREDLVEAYYTMRAYRGV